jgi:cytochrome c peroxidase
MFSIPAISCAPFLRRFTVSVALLGLSACGGGGAADTSSTDPDNPTSTDPAVSAVLNIDMTAPLNYTNPSLPVHYDADVMGGSNTPNSNPITNAGATLGRVLFHDKRLSINNTVACASCHQASLGFDDSQRLSLGFDGVSTTTAHAMRLANSRFYRGGGTGQMFWDRRAASLEAQATEPIINAVEMGFDANHGGLSALIDKMGTLTYYAPLFAWAFGDSAITQERIQAALAQFQRTLISSDSRWDQAYATVYVNTGNKNIGTPLPQLSASEERGRRLFMLPRNNGGAGCAACHVPPTFALAANSRSNGLDAGETTLFKSPSLKNVGLSRHFMHDGRFNSLAQVMAHYARGIVDGPARDNRLPVGGLGLSNQDQADLVAFMHTLTDTTLNNDARFSDPFIR